MYIAKYMSTPPVTIPPSMSIAAARELLKTKKFRHLPVTDEENRIVGMVTDRDLRSAYPSSVLTQEMAKKCLADLEKTPVSTIMTTAFHTLKPESTLDDALIILDREMVGALPVLDDDHRVVGVFSIRDLILAYRKLFGLGERGSAMIVVEEDGGPRPMTRILRILEEHDIHFTRVIRRSPEEDHGRASIFLRVNTFNLGKVRQHLDEAGFKTIIPHSPEPNP